ncbi:ParB N-terminal domain-containing protein [Enterococcus sp. DIV0170]|uniref:ParB N-terminal domain-containing protein n=1 Tax=Enterococcus sp. DIV0170 TaxID=2774642 RepID=UPI003F269E44
MDKSFGNVYLASEYDQFKLIRGNRPITLNRKLEKSILEKGILRPITVNSNMEILDGQHRYTIAKKYNIPLPYYVSESKSIDDIIDLNNASHRWKIEDYIHKFKEEGLLSYIRLYEIIIDYKNVALADLCSTAQGYLNKSYFSFDSIKDGEFEFVNYEEFITCLKDFQEFIYKTRIRSTTGVFSAFFGLYTIKKFNLSSFIERINVNDTRSKIIGIRDGKRILRMFVEAYNYNLKEGSKNYIDYKVKKDRSIVILEKRNRKLLNYINKDII